MKGDEIELRLDAILKACINRGSVEEIYISEAETILGLLFPPSYRIFLSRFGASLCQGYEIYGLDPYLNPGEMPQWNDVVKATVDHRPDCLPSDSIEISDNGMGLGYFLQCSASDPEYEGQVIEWGADNNGGKVVFTSFLEFLEAQCCP